MLANPVLLMLANPVTRSTGVGPSLSDDDEVPEVLGQDSDTSSSDDTVLSHAQELVSRGRGFRSSSTLESRVGTGILYVLTAINNYKLHST